MPVTFSLADFLTRAVVNEAMRAHCPRLAEAGVEVGVIFASSDKEDVPALRRKGATIAATMQVVSLKDRVLKQVDCQMVINREVWAELRPGERAALAHHELLHVDLKEWKYVAVFGADGKPQHVVDDATGELVIKTELTFERDDLGRPKLTAVHGDIDIGDGHSEVVRVHGEDALEYQSLVKGHRWAEERMKQYWERRKERARPERPVDVSGTWADAAGEVVTVGAGADDEESAEREG